MAAPGIPTNSGQPTYRDHDRGGHPVDSTMSFDQYPNLVNIRSSAVDPLNWRHLENLERIGQGIFGNVYRAWDALLQREVALKLCGLTDDSTEAWAHFTLQEARLLARIRHPNVVTVYGVDYHEGTLGVWMEYIRGCTLATFLREHGQLAVREAARIGIDVCSGVACAHALGFLHRDIKTKNVMRESTGRIVLLDFGLSQDLHNTTSTEAALQIRGTILYMAPEVMRGEQASVQSDIYGIGVMLYHLVTRCYPATGRNLKEVRGVHERGDVMSLRDRRTDLPESFLRIVERSLCPEPAGRFATADEMAQALSGCTSDRPW